MKAYKRITAALAALILCFSMQAAAFATDDTQPAIEPVAAPKPSIDISFEGKDWDDVVDELLEQFNTTRYSISAAYVNLVTGEEHYINPDNYMRAASMYKLPLNMYFDDTQNGGIENWIDNYPGIDFIEYREKTLLESDNDRAVAMYDLLGGYSQFRLLTAEYMGSSADTVDATLFMDNLYCANDFAQCLKLLYNESERFPNIIDAMLQANQDMFFCSYENSYPVAHKYGEFTSSTDGVSYTNDCGIAFTTQPIALVMFTKNVGDASGLLGAYCSTMCKYADYVYAAAQASPEPTVQPSPEVTKSESESVTVVEAEAEEKGFPFVAVAAVLLFVVVALALVIRLSIKYKLRVLWLLLAIIVSAGTMVLSIVGVRTGTVYANPSGDPHESAAEFLDSICSGDYSTAYGLLRDYSDLGLETVPETAAAKLAYSALHESFSYELKGEVSVNKLDAVQPFSFTYLDLTKLESAIVDETPNQLRRLVATRPMNQIYDEDRNFLPEVTEEAYINAVTAVLENSSAYYSTIELELQLSYSDGRWQVLTSPALLKALNGGAGY